MSSASDTPGALKEHHNPGGIFPVLMRQASNSKQLECFFCVLIAANTVLQLSVQFHWFDLSHLKGWVTLGAAVLTCCSVAVFLGCTLIFPGKVQVSLRLALCILTAIAVPLAGLGRELQRASLQRNCLTTLKEKRGSWYRYRVEHGKLRKAASWPRRCLIDALGDDFFFNVEWLDISARQDGFERLRDIRFLYGVNLRQCKIDDGTLMNLIEEQPYLKFLGLERTSITDEGLKHLHTARNLEQLWLSGTKVTQQGLQLLQTTLPNCQINHSF